MTEIRLVVGVRPDLEDVALERVENPPSLLIAYPWLERFQGRRGNYHFSEWVLDSGAFTAHATGEPVDLGKYIEDCLELQEADDGPVEIFSLDVIGNWRASRKNTQTMVDAGVRCVPTFHYGSPSGELADLAAAFPKVALGGVARMKGTRNRWLRACFSQVWPKLIHGFGITGERLLLELPFDTVDSSSWQLRPAAYGQWKAYGGQQVSWPGGVKDIRPEVQAYARLEDRLRRVWGRHLEPLRREVA